MSNVPATAKQFELAQKLNETVFSVIGNDKMAGFEKAYQIANATIDLKGMLTTEYMKPIMALQGSRLGFKTDKDDKGGYPENVVKDCLIEAVLLGVQPFGNQFNIIAGNCYITKEGFGYLLPKFPGLNYEIIPALPRINPDKSSAAIDMQVKWTWNGESKEQILPIPVKMNAYMGTDAIIGKATRKARAWLFNTITGFEVGDGDASEFDGKTMPVKENVRSTEQKEADRIELLIGDCKSLDELLKLESYVKPEQMDIFKAKREALA